MKVIIGLLCILAGLAIGAYLGLWLCLVGGIIQIIEAAKATPIESFGIAVGVLRCLVTGIVFWLGALIPIGFGVAIMKD
jgi:hypothetical protein